MIEQLKSLVKEYNDAPEIFQAGRYWKSYEDRIIKEIESADISQLRSGKYPIFGTFGFSESVYHYHPKMPFHVKFIKKLIRKLFITNKASLPYSLRLNDIREMAYQNCLKSGRIAGLKSISEIETSTFGNPDDLFEINGKKYTMQFLNFYLRLCFAQEHLKLNGDEVIIELGTGSGFQTEVMKKVFPNITILCFDLPHALVLCEKYLKEALSENEIIGTQITHTWDSAEQIEKGKVHFFGSWRFPILKGFKFDVFWNAASFGEMEPAIVENYLSYILPNCNNVFLLQARKGKESGSGTGVDTPITFEDYCEMLNGYQVISEEDAYEAHRRMSQSGGYFQAVWGVKH